LSILAKFSILDDLGKSTTMACTLKCIAKLISYVIIASDLNLMCSYGESHSVMYELILASTKSDQ